MGAESQQAGELFLVCRHVLVLLAIACTSLPALASMFDRSKWLSCRLLLVHRRGLVQQLLLTTQQGCVFESVAGFTWAWEQIQIIRV